MEEILWTLFFIFPIILGAIALYFAKYARKRGISPKKKREYYQNLEYIEVKSPSERMIAYDKLLAHILEDLGYRGSVADKLKKRPKILTSSIQEIWRLHKIRNSIAHDLQTSFDETRDPESFEQILRTILAKV